MIVYRAINKTNGKCYIGITTKLLKDRIYKHKYAYRTKNYKFYMAIRKYGFDNFDWIVIDSSKDADDLKAKEVAWIEYYDSYRNGYNSTLGGDGTIGHIRNVSDETREKLRISSTGRKLSKETRARMSEMFKGEGSSKSKLTVQDVLDIRKLLYNGMSQSEVARMYSVRRYCIYAIKTHRTWSYI